MAADGWYTYTGREAVPPDVTRVRIDESLTVIPAYAFDENPNIEEVKCHDRVKTVEDNAFRRLVVQNVLGPSLPKLARLALCTAHFSFLFLVFHLSCLLPTTYYLLSSSYPDYLSAL
eukprot:scaffold13533_cov90-Skeletonema_dohrnii-CCMP3373.AAC.6